MRRLIFALMFAALPLAAALVGAHEAALKGCATLRAWRADCVAQPFRAAVVAQSRPADIRGAEIDALDRKADPCVDFYQFACAGWVAKNPLRADRRSYGRFAEVQDRNFTILRRILDGPRREGDEGKASDYFAACMDDSTIESAGLTPLQADLRTIDELVNPDDLPVLLAHLHAIGVRALFRFGAQTDVVGDATQQIADVDQSGLSLPDRDYYVKTDDRSVDVRAKFVATVEKIFQLAGSAPDQAAPDAKAVLGLETALAIAQMDRVQRRDPKNTLHTMPLNDLQAMTPNFSWRKYGAAAEAPKFQVLNVAALDYLKALDRLIGSQSPPSDIKAYLRWHLLHGSAELLPKAFADAAFDFFSRTLPGQPAPPPRWRRCVTEVDQRLGEALGKAFVGEAFGTQAKADMLKMVQDIKGAMQQDIDAAPWMSGETKKAAMAKLNKVVDRIGYPDTWRDYANVRIARDDALGNRQRTLAFA